MFKNTTPTVIRDTREKAMEKARQNFDTEENHEENASRIPSPCTGYGIAFNVRAHLHATRHDTSTCTPTIIR